MELKKNSCEEKLQITQVSYSFPFFFLPSQNDCYKFLRTTAAEMKNYLTRLLCHLSISPYLDSRLQRGHYYHRERPVVPRLTDGESSIHHHR
jgi:hypothetical protein